MILRVAMVAEESFYRLMPGSELGSPFAIENGGVCHFVRRWSARAVLSGLGCRGQGVEYGLGYYQPLCW